MSGRATLHFTPTTHRKRERERERWGRKRGGRERRARDMGKKEKGEKERRERDRENRARARWERDKREEKDRCGRAIDERGMDGEVELSYAHMRGYQKASESDQISLCLVSQLAQCLSNSPLQPSDRSTMHSSNSGWGTNACQKWFWFRGRGFNKWLLSSCAPAHAHMCWCWNLPQLGGEWEHYYPREW